MLTSLPESIKFCATTLSFRNQTGYRMQGTRRGAFMPDPVTDAEVTKTVASFPRRHGPFEVQDIYLHSDPSCHS